MDDIIKEILRQHDELSKLSVFSESDDDRQRAFIKAEALRELINGIRDNVIPERFKDKFVSTLNDHFNGLTKGLFYNRKVTFDD